MGYRLGIDLGTTFTAAAFIEDAGPRMLELGNRNLTMPSVLFLTDDGTWLFGEAAERRSWSEPERVLREFKRRIGDTVPLVVADQTFSPSTLQTELLRRVLQIAEERLGGPPDHVVVTYPANWGLFKIQLLRDIVTAAGIPGAGLCPEPVAAAIEYAAKQRVPVGAKVAVYDLGGGTFDVAILEKTDDGFEIIGTPLGVDHLGGLDFDEAVLTDAMSKLGLGGLDPDDPATARGLSALHQDCIEAKEALSSDVSTDITSLLPGVAGRQARLTRNEFEALIRPALEESIRTTVRALRLAGVDNTELHAVVLVGGSSRIPLVTELLNRDVAVPVAADTFPKHDIALGAARYALLQTPQPPPEQIVDPAPITPAVPGRRPRRLAVLVTTTVLLAVGLIGTLVWQPWRHRAPTPSAGPTVTTDSAPPEPTVTISKLLVNEKFSTGKLPSDWQPIEGKWKVVNGRLQSNVGDTRARIQFGPTTPANYRIETTIRFVAVKNDSRWLNVGLDYHAKKDWGAVFVVRKNTTADNGLELAQRKLDEKKFTSDPVASSSIAASVGKKHRLSIEVRGQEMDVTLDDEPVFHADNLARTSGQFGFVTGSSTVQFDNVEVLDLH